MEGYDDLINNLDKAHRIEDAERVFAKEQVVANMDDLNRCVPMLNYLYSHFSIANDKALLEKIDELKVHLDRFQNAYVSSKLAIVENGIKQRELVTQMEALRAIKNLKSLFDKSNT